MPLQFAAVGRKIDDGVEYGADQKEMPELITF
jgi:hypothetical protein